MTRPRHPRSARRGFTLVELMVACALVVLILTILAVAFGAATDSLSRLRSMGDMAERLRTAQTKMQVDLHAQHFETGDSPAQLRLSDLRYNLLTSGGNEAFPPRGGYFRIEQGPNALTGGSTYEGVDPDLLMSTRAVNHALEFTVKREGKSPDDLFTITSPTLVNDSVTDTALGANQFSTHWARVRWQLGNPQTNSAGVTTYTLYRSVRLLAPAAPNAASSRLLANPAERELVSTPAVAPFNPHTIQTIISPLVRAASPITPYGGASTSYGDDIVLTNVTSFSVKPTWDAPPINTGPREPRSTSGVNNRQLPNTTVGNAIADGFGTSVNSEAPYDDLPVTPNLPSPPAPPNAPENPAFLNQRVFDTWAPLTTSGMTPTSWNVPGSNDSIPLRIRVTALQIQIRVFDPKNLLSRQVTFIVQQ